MPALKSSPESWLPPVYLGKNLGKLATILPLLDWDFIDGVLREQLRQAAIALVGIHPALRTRVLSVRGRSRYLFSYLEVRGTDELDEDAIILGISYSLAPRSAQSEIRIEADISREESGEILFSSDSTYVQCAIDKNAVVDASRPVLETLITQLFTLREVSLVKYHD